MNHPKKIDQFVSKIRYRLNRFRLFDALIWACLGAAAILLGLCLFYILRGYPVPRDWYLLAGGGAILGAIITWILRRWSNLGAAHFADNFFGLKDALSSSLAFRLEKREGEFFDLQERTTVEQLDQLKPEDVSYKKPNRLLLATLVLVGLCTLAAFKEASPEIVEQLRVEEETDTRTAEINEYLEEVIEELAKDADEEEKEILDPDQLKEWVDSLQQTKDRKQAMRQYAQLERKLQEAARRIDQRKNEKLLARAAEELQKDDESRALGKKLEQKKYKEAAKDLSAMKPAKMQDHKLSEQRKELARLKSASQRMMAAAKSFNRKSNTSSKQSGNRDSQSGQQQQSSQNSSASPASSGGQNDGATGTSSQNSGGQIDSDMAALDAAIKQFDRAMENAAMQEMQFGKCDSDSLNNCQSCRQKLLSDLDKLCKSMRKCQNLSQYQSKLLSMCKKLGQCQSFLSQQKGLSLAQCLGSKPGGQKAGTGSVESRRSETDFLSDNGNTSQLKGIQGQGPSQSTVEAAEEGSGASSKRSAQRKIEFSRQVESFVQREDVPEDVKQGVKNYFENIHEDTTDQ